MDAKAHDFWYDEPEYGAHDALFDYIRTLNEEQSDFREANRWHAQFYSNREEPGLGGSTFSRRRWAAVTENVIASVVDTAKTLVGKSKPKITVLTEGGSWELQRVAKQLDKFIFGMFQCMGVYKIMPDVFRDACVFGTGCIKLIADEDAGDVYAERVLIDNIYIDEGEVPAGGMPRQIHEVRLVSKAVLEAEYPEAAVAIRSSLDNLDDSESSDRYIDSDMVLVTDSYVLSPGGDSPGRFIRAVSDGTLEDTDWTEEYVPYIFFRYNNPVTGWYGQGLVEHLIGFQVRINELNDYIRQCHDLIAVPRVFVEQASRTLRSHFTDDIGHVVNYTGRPPTFLTATALNAETYNRVVYLKESAFEFAGISKMAAHATRPEGIEAAVALRELSDNQSQRLGDQQARIEEAYVELAELLTNVVRSMRKKPKVYATTKYVEYIDWPEADFKKHRFTFRAMPSSILGETPAGKKQTIIEFAQYGIPLAPEEARRLLDHPDLEQSDALIKARLEHVHWVINELMHERFVQPDAYMDLTQGIKLVNAAYLNLMMVGDSETGEGKAPEVVLEMFRQWLELAEAKMVEMSQPTPEQQAQMQQAALAEIPEGNVAEGAAPGIAPAGADTGETGLLGFLG